MTNDVPAPAPPTSDPPHGPLARHFRAAHAAVTFLTRIPWPFPATDPPTPDDLARSTLYFPLVGVLVGAVGAALNWLGTLIWPAPVAIVIALAGMILLTGALHEDGLADAADGLGGGWSRDQTLAIMKDSRIGSYGAVAIVLSIAIKVATLSTLAPIDVARALIAGHTLGRWTSLPLLRRSPYVRESRGAGAPYAGAVTVPRLTVATLLTVAVVAALLGWRALPVLAAVIVVTVLAGWYFRRRLGGITGDCLGATNQCAELATYLVLAAQF